MRPHPFAFVLLPLVLLAATRSPAATPLPDPPFTGGGYVPVSKYVLKQEVAVLKVLANYTLRRSSCDTGLLDDLVLAYTSASGSKIVDVEAQWVACVTKAEARYAYERDKVLAKGTPPCLGSTEIDTLRAFVDLQLAAGGSVAFCDADNAAPDPVTSLNVPDKVKEAGGESEAAKRIHRSSSDAMKCLAYVLPRLFRDQTVSADNIDRFSSCLDKLATRAASTADELEQTQQLPSCLPTSALVAAALGARDAAILLSGGVFCQSPGGAFVDGAPVL